MRAVRPRGRSGGTYLRERTNFFAVRLLESTEPGREGESDRALLCHEERAQWI